MDHSVRKFVDFYIFPIETIRLSFSENSIGFFLFFLSPDFIGVSSDFPYPIENRIL